MLFFALCVVVGRLQVRMSTTQSILPTVVELMSDWGSQQYCNGTRMA